MSPKTTNSCPGWVRRMVVAAMILLACLPALATTFTNNASIGISNTNYDGTDVVISNCTVTIDGPHAFSSMHVASGGILTHTISYAGYLTNILYVTNETQVLTGTNLVTLDNTNVISDTVTVTDTNGIVFYTNGLDYLLSSPDGIIEQLQRTTNSAIPDGGTVLVSYETWLGTLSPGVNLSIAGNLQVDSGGAINADGRGYGSGGGSGAGRKSTTSPADGSGGGYGGIGGTSSSNALGGTTYGPYYGPFGVLGSGGGASYAGPGGAGGGMIQILAGGSLILNGSVSANGADGTNSRSGGGSGGSVWLVGLTLSGSGTVAANGGAGEPTHGGGGGGGRIGFQFNTSSFSGSMIAYGGAGATAGGAGTVYTRTNTHNALLVVDNNGQLGTNTTLSISDNTVNVLVRGSASVVPAGAWTIAGLTVASNAVMQADYTTPLSLTVYGAISVQAGGGIIADSRGYFQSGPGVGHSLNVSPYWPCGGGGYGGNGSTGSFSNNLAGAANGTQTSPNAYGSSGGFVATSVGGNGGGLIQITSLGIGGSVVQVDGRISANGGNGSGMGGGGGSGGTIVLSGGTLVGSGSITANGGSGAGSIGGGGGGGRIYMTPAGNLFAGNISASGGGGGGWGGAGTVYLQVPGQNTQLILDNGGNLGTNTPVQTASSADLIVRNGAIGSASSTASFFNLFVNSNSWLAPVFGQQAPFGTVNFTFSGNATVQAGGGIIADLAGYAASGGTGAGKAVQVGSTNYCSGAGHGGYGGNSSNNIAIGGITYDTPTSPSTAGSGGGGTLPSLPGTSVGGYGGGIVRLTVTGTLELDGTISANGGSGSGFAGGGGAGGAIWLTTGTISGGGSVAANGGSGAGSIGGGGAGGMIFVTCNNNLFSGTLNAFGGSGGNWGGEGTAIIQASGKNGQLVLDNGGHSGPATPLPSSSTIDVTLRGGAVGLLSSQVTVGNLVISSNAWIIATNSSAGLQVTSATIQAGGGIIADGYGFAAGLGSGAGHSEGGAPYYPCGGAGHGGLGGTSAGNYAGGGGVYDSQTAPVSAGSGGGFNQGISFGGAGGGVLSVTTKGLLQIDGIISANGLNGTGPGGGGGSGGSIKIFAGTLVGGGIIAANGGNGVGAIGGGGGGGIIALTPTANLFSGTVAAYGGSGANPGGAGTIYIQTNGPNSQLIVDNGGPTGGGTPIQTIPSSTSIILRNGAAAYQQFPPQTFASLFIGSNAVLEANPTLGNNYPGIVNLTVSSATIQTGGGIVTDGAGSGANSGTGAGHVYTGSTTNPGSGGGFGGNGGNSIGNLATGGGIYGSITSPASNGSGGGGSSPNSIGGAGGGQLHLTVSGTLDASGRISANGANGSGLGGGGGSGGSILLTVGNLVGAGTITANGGSGVDSIGGGGGGGRIYLNCSTENFNGAIGAQGGGGYANGGAGTVFTQVGSAFGAQSIQLLVDNGGQAGAITPLSASLGLPGFGFNLTIQNGGVVLPQQVGFPLLSNLTIGAGGTLSAASGPSTLDLVVLNNVDIGPGGLLIADAKGYGQGIGPGKGLTSGGLGSGAGYGGSGGASTTIEGGGTYGSAAQPIDFGSGGGVGSQTLVGGSQGGGALRLNVGGILTVDGQLSSEGGPGIQDNSGGGSGGSIWVTAGMLAGGGLVAVDGGDGELYGGGGGGGGRIALYSRTNVFYGALSAVGGDGDFAGGSGSIVNSNGIPSLQIMSNSPSGTVTSTVSAVTLFFNDAPKQSSVTASSISLTGPNGAVSSLTISQLTSSSYQVSFPQQIANGAYTLNVNAGVTDLYGQALVPYTGTFAISLPVIQGTVTDTNGHPIAGVVLPGSGSSATTDANGNYNLSFVPGSSFTVTPSLGGLIFSPASISYTNVSTSVSNQNYLVVGSLAPSLKAGMNAGNFVLQWQAIGGVNYQIFYSTNLVNWLPYGSSFNSSNGAVQIGVPIGAYRQEFFRVQAGN